MLLAVTEGSFDLLQAILMPAEEFTVPLALAHLIENSNAVFGGFLDVTIHSLVALGIIQYAVSFDSGIFIHGELHLAFQRFLTTGQKKTEYRHQQGRAKRAHLGPR